MEVYGKRYLIFGGYKQINEYDVFASELIPDAIVALQAGETPMGDVTIREWKRKTSVNGLSLWSFLKDGGFMEMNSDLDEKRVLLIDTEQSDASNVMKRIFEWAGIFSTEVKDRLRVLSERIDP